MVVVYWKKPEFHSPIILVLHQNCRHASFSPNWSTNWNKANDTCYNSRMTRFQFGFTNHKTLQYWGSKTSTFQYYLLWLHASVETSALNKLLHPHVQSTSHYISTLPHSLSTALMDVMTPKTTLQCKKLPCFLYDLWHMLLARKWFQLS